MDPRTYCEQSIAEVLGHLRPGGDFETVQRGVVLAYLRERYRDAGPSEFQFTRDLERLATAAEVEGKAAAAEATRAILRDWQAQRARHD